MTTHEQPDPDTQECGGCLYWRMAFGDGYTGECHRHAPVALKLQRRHYEVASPSWPETFHNEWCGDFVRGER